MLDLVDVYNWRRLSELVTTSGQPTERQLADIAALGVRHVVNLGLHTHPEALRDEPASVAALGMTYSHIPVDFRHPTALDFARFCAVVGAHAAVQLHVHCIANYRVSAFFYRYRRDILGQDEAAARADLEDVWTPDAVWAAFVAPRPG